MSFLANFSAYKGLNSSAVVCSQNTAEILKCVVFCLVLLESLLPSPPHPLYSPSEIFAVVILACCGFGQNILGWFTDFKNRRRCSVPAPRSPFLTQAIEHCGVIPAANFWFSQGVSVERQAAFQLRCLTLENSQHFRSVCLNFQLLHVCVTLNYFNFSCQPLPSHYTMFWETRKSCTIWNDSSVQEVGGHLTTCPSPGQ